MPDPLALDHPGLTVLATSVVDRADPGDAPRRISGVYADPATWLAAEAVGEILDPAALDGRETGVIGVSEHATRHTLRMVAVGVPKARISPMRFAAASPGSLVGVICTSFGLRGPTSMLSMPPGDALPVATALAADWLAGPVQMAGHVLVVTHEIGDDDRHRARCALLSGAVPRHSTNGGRP